MRETGFNASTATVVRKFIYGNVGKIFMAELLRRLPSIKYTSVDEAALTGAKNGGYLQAMDQIDHMAEPNNYNDKGRKQGK